MKEKIKQLLEAKPEARKIKNKYKVISYLIMKKYAEKINEDIIYDIIKMDRLIRKVKEENLELSGDSKEEKEILEQEAQIEL